MLRPSSALSVQANPFLSMPDAFTPHGLPPRATVLLAEDDDDLRCVMEWTLKSMGYLVMACPDAQSASFVFRSHGEIDVLLTDFKMPGRSGVELARELTSLHPELPVMIITGSILGNSIRQEIQDRRWIYISKPCHLESVARTLEGMLNSRQSVAQQRAAECLQTAR